ncbi:MAG TPA: MotA/TolQ/ExbB proton channel family protein [Phycisphaerales bacterium]|nr:MotA/TolQ/ExbB proton channel family protein [Phycisphaerales bacterium]
MIHWNATLVPDPNSAVAVQSVWDFVEKGGILMFPLALCSLIAIAVAAERFVLLRRSRIIPAGIADRCDEAIRAGQSADEFRQAEPSPAGRLLGAGMEKLGHGPDVVERHLASEGEHEVHVMRRRLRALVVITGLAPLLGLTGTIFGMIKAFQTVALSAEALGKAELLARGIYEAMITTAAGLLVAMPTIVVYHFLASRVEQMAHELDRLAVSFLNKHLHDPLGPRPARPHEPAPNGERIPEVAVAVG